MCFEIQNVPEFRILIRCTQQTLWNTPGPQATQQGLGQPNKRSNTMGTFTKNEIKLINSQRLLTLDPNEF